MVRGSCVWARAEGSDDLRQPTLRVWAAQVTAMHEQALQQDASVFDYDGVYDEMQAAKVQPKQQEKIQRHSR